MLCLPHHPTVWPEQDHLMWQLQCCWQPGQLSHSAHRQQHSSVAPAQATRAGDCRHLFRWCMMGWIWARVQPRCLWGSSPMAATLTRIAWMPAWIMSCSSCVWGWCHRYAREVSPSRAHTCTQGRLQVAGVRLLHRCEQDWVGTCQVCLRSGPCWTKMDSLTSMADVLSPMGWATAT